MGQAHELLHRSAICNVNNLIERATGLESEDFSKKAAKIFPSQKERSAGSGGFSTSSGAEIADRQVQRLLDAKKLRQIRDQIADAQAERPFQRALAARKRVAERDAMAAAQDAEQNYGKFSVGSGFGLGFRNPQYDTASDQARHAMALEFLSNATKGAAPGWEIRKILKNTRGVDDFTKMLEEDKGGDIEPQSLPIAERDNLKEALKLKLQRDLLKSLGRGF